MTNLDILMKELEAAAVGASRHLGAWEALEKARVNIRAAWNKRTADLDALIARWKAEAEAANRKCENAPGPHTMARWQNVAETIRQCISDLSALIETKKDG